MKDDIDLADLKKLKRSKRINSRTKGNAFERKIAKLLNEHYNTTEFMRTPGSGAFATTHKLPEHLQVHGDLITPKDFPFLIECKKGYKFTISDLYNLSSKFWEIWKKLNIECNKTGKLPLLIFQQDRQNILCMIDMPDNYPRRYNDIGNNIEIIISLEDFLSKVQPTL